MSQNIDIKIVLVSGKQGSGKTTTCDQLAKEWHERFGYDVEHLTFASTIYAMHDSIRAILTKNGINIPDEVKVKDGPLLQWLGTEWGRSTIGENVWVDCLKGQINNLIDLHVKRGDRKLLFLVSDCRFPNEFDSLPAALRVRLECPKEIRKKRCSMWRENDTHPSEIALDGYVKNNMFDLVVHTDGDDVNCAVGLIGAQLTKNVWKEKR